MQKFWPNKFVKNNICLFKKNWVKILFGKNELSNMKFLGQKISGQKNFLGDKPF